MRGARCEVQSAAAAAAAAAVVEEATAVGAGVGSRLPRNVAETAGTIGAGFRGWRVAANERRFFC
jgi:hypothetical protein